MCGQHEYSRTTAVEFLVYLLAFSCICDVSDVIKCFKSCLFCYLTIDSQHPWTERVEKSLKLWKIAGKFVKNLKKATKVLKKVTKNFQKNAANFKKTINKKKFTTQRKEKV